MKWPEGTFEASTVWWTLGEEGRRPVLDALALLGFEASEVRAVTFGPASATVTVIHRNKDAHMDGHCEQPVIVSDIGGVMRCNCGRTMGQAHSLCVMEQTVDYPA